MIPAPARVKAGRKRECMKEIKVRILEEYRDHVNPERKYHLEDVESGREIIGNLKKEDIEKYVTAFRLTLLA